MIAEKTRNFIVGLTFLVALILVAYGVLMLGKTPSLLGGTRPYTINIMAENANAVTSGSKVDLNGVVIGQVQSVSLVEEDGKFLARISMGIDQKYEIPKAAKASISKSVTGTTAVSISAVTLRGEKLPRDGSGTISASASDVSGLIPNDIRDNLNNVSQQLSIVAHDLHVLLAYNTPEEVDEAERNATQPGANTRPGSRPVANIATLVGRLNHTMKSLDQLLTDQTLHNDIRQIVTNLREASASVNTTLANINITIKNADKAFNSMGTITASAQKTFDTTQVQIVKISEKLVEMLGQIEKATRQISEGGGTTGKMINDPRLYEGLVDLSKTLNSTAKDLDFLLKKWKDEGVKFNLK